MPPCVLRDLCVVPANWCSWRKSADRVRPRRGSPRREGHLGVIRLSAGHTRDDVVMCEKIYRVCNISCLTISPAIFFLKKDTSSGIDGPMEVNSSCFQESLPKRDSMEAWRSINSAMGDTSIQRGGKTAEYGWISLRFYRRFHTPLPGNGGPGTSKAGGCDRQFQEDLAHLCARANICCPSQTRPETRR